LTIQAYIDDSGVKGTDAVFVLAGFIGRAEKWAEFSDAWRECLRESPSIQYLKMREAAKFKGQFRFWKAEERDNKLARCAEVIKKFPPDKGIYMMNDLVAWEQLAENPVKLLTDPHFMGFFGVINAVCNEIVSSGTSEQVEIIFDEHVIFGPRVAHWYPVVKEMLQADAHMDTPISLLPVWKVMPPYPMFRDDKQFAPLQAADILAWLLRNAFRDRLPGLESVWHPADTEFDWLAADLLPHIPPSDYSVIYGDSHIARLQELSKQIKFAPELMLKWQNRLGIHASRPKKKRKGK
jgi:hypothetical protein